MATGDDRAVPLAAASAAGWHASCTPTLERQVDGRQGEDAVGDQKRAKDLSRRDQGYPYVPLDEARPSWEPAPGGRNDGRGGRSLLPLVVGVIVLVVVVALVIGLLA